MHQIVIIDNAGDAKEDEKTPTSALCNALYKIKIPHTIVRTAEELNNVSRPIGFILTGTTVYTPPHKLQSKIALNVAPLTLYPEVPILGICWGYQILVHAHGGDVQELPKRNEGIKSTKVDNMCALFLHDMMSSRIKCTYSHNNYISKLPSRWRPAAFLAYDHNILIVAAQHPKKPRYGIMFHPEQNDNTLFILKNFYNICKIKMTYYQKWWSWLTRKFTK